MKVLFLCHANMCRSPLAAGLLKLILKTRNIDAEVDSAGFEAYHINEPPDARAIAIGLGHGFDISGSRVRLFTPADFDQFDKIYVMDTLAYRNAIYFARNEGDIEKLEFLMNVLIPGKNESVPDPFFRNLDDSDKTFNILSQACTKIADSLVSKSVN
ncbi:MAG: low molecular weight protein-tyrosine-phosphatase [Bacteroidales bacterium]